MSFTEAPEELADAEDDVVEALHPFPAGWTVTETGNEPDEREQDDETMDDRDPDPDPDPYPELLFGGLPCMGFDMSASLKFLNFIIFFFR